MAPTTSAARAATAALPPATDRRWLPIVMTSALVLCGLPSLLAALAGPTTLERAGPFWFILDHSQYQAAMRQAAESPSWLVHNQFTAEPHAPALMYPLYTALGKLAARTHISTSTLFAVLEWLARMTLLGALYAFAATFLPTGKPRRLALLLVLASMGLAGWAVPLWLALGGLGIAAGGQPPSPNYYLEFSSLGILLAAPHLMLGLGLTLLSVPLYLRARRSGNARDLGLFGAAIFALSLVHSFNLPVLVSVFAVETLLTLGAARARPLAQWRTWLPMLLAVAASLPIVTYNLLVFQVDPFWSATYSAQNQMPSPLPWSLPIDFGLVLLAAPLAWPVVRTWPAAHRRLLLVWLAVGLAWMYAPFPYQRRFAFGLQPAFAVAAAVGLLWANQVMRERKWGPLARRSVNYSVAFIALMTSVVVYGGILASAVANRPAPVYQWSVAEADAARWLASRTGPSDVFLASRDHANALVALVSGRVVVGHQVATLDYASKLAMLRRFYAAGTSISERTALLAEMGASYVALGPRERALGIDSLQDQPGLTLVYDREDVAWYRVHTP